MYTANNTQHIIMTAHTEQANYAILDFPRITSTRINCIGNHIPRRFFFQITTDRTPENSSYNKKERYKTHSAEAAFHAFKKSSFKVPAVIPFHKLRDLSPHKSCTCNSSSSITEREQRRIFREKKKRCN